MEYQAYYACDVHSGRGLLDGRYQAMGLIFDARTGFGLDAMTTITTNVQIDRLEGTQPRARRQGGLDDKQVKQ